MGGLLAGMTGGVVGGAVVKLFLDDAAYQKSMTEADAKGKNVTSTFGRMKVMGALAFAAVAAAAIKFGVAATQAASDQNEALNKAQVVFGEYSQRVEDFAKSAALSFGISTTAALQAAGGFGQMLQTAGLMQKEATGLSISLVALAGDLSSFNNIGTDEALEKLRSGLAGEAEPLRTMGVFLSEARVKAEAYASGIAKTGSELTEAQKVQARYNVILKDTNLAQGDFANTSESLANQQKSFTAQWENFLATAGPGIAAFFAKVLFYLNDLIVKFPEIAGLFENAFIDVANVFIYAFNIFKTAFLNPILHAFNVIIQAVDTALGPLADFGSIPMVGTVNALEEVEHQLDDTGKAAQVKFKLIKGASFSASKAMSQFAQMSSDELDDWRKSVDDNFDSFVHTLAVTEDAAAHTGHEFVTAIHAMLKRAGMLSAAMRKISAEKWINPDYIKFLSEQGPAWLIGFTRATEEQQRKTQAEWEKSVQKTDAAESSLDKVSRALQGLGHINAVANVTVNYKTSGIDPRTLPGLGSNP